MGYRCVTKYSELAGYLQDAKLVAFDFETSPTDDYRNEEHAALDAHKAQITGISFSVKEGSAVYVPLRHITGKNAEDRDELFGYLKKEIFENAQIVKIAHNLAFESMFLYALGIVIKEPVYDTIAAAQLTLKNKWEFRSLSDSGLKPLAASLFGVQLPDFMAVTGGRHFDELDPQDNETIRYACADSDYALRLYHRLNSWFDKFLPSHRFIAEKIESPTAIYCGLMKYNGLPMDRELMTEKQKEAQEKIERLKREIDEITGGVNIGANAATSAFKKYLYQDLGLPVLRTTEKDRDAADDQTLIMLRDWCTRNCPGFVRLFDLVQEYRKWSKLKSTYIDGFLRHINPATNRIHPDLMPLATQTGRFAARNPNMQTCPRKGNDPIGVRNFIAAPKCKAILSLDFSQIELRVGAFYCRDKRLLDTYRTGGDIHAQTAAVIYNIPLSEASDKNTSNYKARRTIAKNCNFGVFYGLFPGGLQRTLQYKAGLKTTIGTCGHIIDNIKRGYPGLTGWQDTTRKRAANTCFAETWLGRRRFLIGIRSEDWGKRAFAERCALNTPIQGTAADILKLACGRIVAGINERTWLKPLLQIHDELVFEVPVERLAEAAEFVKTCMEAKPFPEFDVPIVAEAAAGRNFGDLKELEE